jgi:Zn-dependent protease with chaperone function
MKKQRTLVTALTLALTTVGVAGQTRVTPPENKYSIAEDVKLGREAAQEARRQLPILREGEVTSYVDGLGRRLVRAIPSDLRHDQFRYTFETVNVREINAFALPGGPMFVNRGTIEAAKNEGELAGVMAHEIAHVALRHGTAQASKATPYQVGGLLGGLAGAIIGGTLGQVVSEGSQFVSATWFMKYGREFERQADTLGAQIMARAGYDPRDMANMFRTIERQSGSGGPEWLSSHPNPGNRYDAINREAQVLHVQNPIRNAREFDQARAYLRRLPRAPTMEDVGRRSPRSTSGSSRGDVRPTGRVQAPSTRYTEYNEGNLFTVRVPSNWREIASTSAVTFAPDGAHGRYNGQSVFTHGVEIGVARHDERNLQTATDELIDSLRDGNPSLTRGGRYARATIDGRRALRTTLENVSEATGQREIIQMTTTQTANGDLLYVIGVAPRSEFNVYQTVFQRVSESIRLN